MYSKLADFVIRHSKAVLIVCGLVAVFCATNLPRLGFNFTPQQLFRSSGDALDYREEFAERFGREDNLVFIAVESDDIFRPDVLQFTRDLTQRLRTLEFVEAADSIATMELPRPGDSPGVLATDPIIGSSGPVDEETANRLRNAATEEPLVRGQVVGKSGELTAILVWIDGEVQDIEVLHESVDMIATAIEQTGVPDNVSWGMGGVPYLRVQIVESLKHQQLTFIPGTALAYFLILLLLFRRPAGVIGPLGVVGIATLMTITLLVATGKEINIINNVLPTLIFIIAVSDSIHMLVRDAEETEGGADRKSSIRGMIRHTGAACLLTSTTTSVGFFSLMAADAQILRDFGWQAGAGVLFAYLVTIFFLPALVVHLKPVKRQALGSSDPDQPALLEKWLTRMGELLLDRPKTFIAAGLTVAAIAAGFGSTVNIDTVLMEVYEPGHPQYETTALLERELSGVLPIEISLESDDPDTFKDPAIFAKMHEIQQIAEQHDVVLGSQSLVDFHQAARAALLGDPAEREVMPDSRDQVEQLHLLIAGAPDVRTGANRYVTSDFQHARILLRVSDAGARAQLRLGEALNKDLERLFADTPVRYRLTGDAYVASAALDSFIRDLFTSLLLAMVIIFAMMTFVFRSLTLGLISTIPNGVPLLLTFGYMGAAGIDLNTTTIIIFAISLGLAVDDTIHFLARFREEMANEENDARAAVLKAFNGAGRAIMITSVMLLIGLLVLLFSDFVPTRQFGKLTAITIAGAILGDLILLPPILFLVFRRREKRRES